MLNLKNIKQNLLKTALMVAIVSMSATAVNVEASYTFRQYSNGLLPESPESGMLGLPETSESCESPGSITYAAAGNFVFNLPAGCTATTLEVKTWGGTGGTGFANVGGGGGYASSTVTVTSSDTILVYVGGKGPNGNGANGGGASGGGASAVLVNSAEIAVAGGGGGGSGYQTVNGLPGCGGTLFTATHNGGAAGAGVGGASGYGPGGAGVYQAYANWRGRGGGGGGYLGGAAGTQSSEYNPTASHGGSCYVTTGGVIEAGSGNNQGGAGDPDYVTNAGNGRIVINWQ